MYSRTPSGDSSALSVRECAVGELAFYRPRGRQECLPMAEKSNEVNSSYILSNVQAPKRDDTSISIFISISD